MINWNDPATQELLVLTIALFTTIIFLAGWNTGRHGRQHWETDRVVEGKLAKE